MEESDTECFDMPEQRMETDQTLPRHQAGRYPVKLNSDAFGRVIDAFEKKMTTSFYYPPAHTELTYTDAVFYQAKHYRKIIDGEVEQYQPILLK